MNTTTYTTLVPWIIAHGYFIFLIIAIVEGPLVTVAAGIAAALGYYNIYIITILSILGDIGGDVLYYGIGYVSKNIIRSKFFRFFGINEERITKIERLVHGHIRKSVLITKFSPIVGPFGHIIIGSTRASFRKFIETATAIAIPKSIFFVLVGFFSVKAYININKTIKHGELAVAIIAAVIGIIYVFYRKFSARVTEKLKDED